MNNYCKVSIVQSCHTNELDGFEFQNFYPVFELHGVNTSAECPLTRSRDLYHIQEAHKQFEHNSRWSCEACGKAFYKQEFLDIHMENKHQDLLVKEEVN